MKLMIGRRGGIQEDSQKVQRLPRIMAQIRRILLEKGQSQSSS